jgi:hypothetical protein
MIDAGLTFLVTVLVMGAWIAAIFLCALAWRIVADWVEDHAFRRRATGVRSALVDVDARRAVRDLPVQSRRTLP